jgi:hypothetical protein
MICGVVALELEILFMLQRRILCTLQLSLDSNKFCNGGERPEQGEQVPLCTCSSTPSVWALKPPSWALVHKTTYAPTIYTALYIMFWMLAYPLFGQAGGGWALEFSGFWDPKWHSPIGSMPFHRALKTLEILAQPPPTCSHNRSARGCINHRCINSLIGVYEKSLIP